MASRFRIGYGEDCHRLEAGRILVLGGVTILESEWGPVAHSDGDAVLHAVSDALLCGVALGDIGQYFPNTDPQWKDVSSKVIVKQSLNLVINKGYQPVNVALAIVIDKPKLAAHRSAIASSVGDLLSLPADSVGITLKTSEGLTPTCVQVRCTLLLEKKEE